MAVRMKGRKGEQGGREEERDQLNLQQSFPAHPGPSYEIERFQVSLLTTIELRATWLEATFAGRSEYSFKSEADCDSPE